MTVYSIRLSWINNRLIKIIYLRNSHHQKETCRWIQQKMLLQNKEDENIKGKQ